MQALLTPLLLLLAVQLSWQQEAQIPSDWIEYTPGTCPLLISVPHGGAVRPTEIEPRTDGCLADGGGCEWAKNCQPASSECKAGVYSDSGTDKIGSALVSELSTTYGCVPHFVRSNLHRSRLDPNREIEEAAQGDELAEEAWRRYHTQYMASAVASIKAQFGKGLVVDIHGQAHAEQWTEIGTLLSAYDLNNARLRMEYSSIHGLSLRSKETAEQLVRGPHSFGGLLSAEGVKTVPSPANPSPNGGGYFSGGFTVKQYGSLKGGSVDAIQVEVNSNTRKNATARQIFSTAMAKAVHNFMTWHDYL